MCSEMSQSMPNSAVISDSATMSAGSATQPGRPVRAPAASAMRASTVVRRVRCATASTSSSSVTKPTPAVAAKTSPSAAPPAGLGSAASRIVVGIMRRT
jgi:hypothetical protein